MIRVENPDQLADSAVVANFHLMVSDDRTSLIEKRVLANCDRATKLCAKFRPQHPASEYNISSDMDLAVGEQDWWSASAQHWSRHVNTTDSEVGRRYRRGNCSARVGGDVTESELHR
jgi:hypothetical protein